MEASTTQDAAAKDAERKAAEEAKQAEREAKAKEREEAKAEKARLAAEAKAQRETEAITKILADLPEDKRPTGDALKDIDRAKARELVKAYKAEERANRPKKAPLTLSQRRAVLNLADAGKKGIVPKTGFNALPLDHLVGVGLAEKFDTQVEKVEQVKEGEGDDAKTVERKSKVDATGYRLTDAGKARAGEINPKWQTWKPDAPATESVEETPAAS